jgi:thioredoxin-dependent peroxiredoxin
MRSVMLLSGLMFLATALSAQSPPPPTGPELKVGDQAPDFELEASDGKTYKLSSFKGKQAVVVAWFPKAYTSGCTVECKSLAENGDKIRKYNVAYFMASVDTLADNKGFAEKEKADFPLLADPTKKTADAYGVLSPRGTASRWTFYIGKDGLIQAIDKAVKPPTSAEDMVAKLGELKVEPKK